VRIQQAIEIRNKNASTATNTHDGDSKKSRSRLNIVKIAGADKAITSAEAACLKVELVSGSSIQPLVRETR